MAWICTLPNNTHHTLCSPAKRIQTLPTRKKSQNPWPTPPAQEILKTAKPWLKARTLEPQSSGKTQTKETKPKHLEASLYFKEKQKHIIKQNTSNLAKFPKSSIAVFLVKCRMAPSMLSLGAAALISGGNDWMSCHLRRVAPKAPSSAFGSKAPERNKKSCF